MACTEEKPVFKHYCRICKKGFMCGRALGGHMRAHGIGDERGNLDDDDDQVSGWEDKHGGADRTSNRRMYQLRTNPNRLKSCRICENCGKEFLCWKSFLEHGKCSSEDAESLVSSPGSKGEYDGGQRDCQWSKRKRSLRTKVDSFSSVYPSSEDEDLLLAKCLVDLANGSVEVEPEESCASESKEEERRNPVVFLAPLSTKGASKGLFECKACKKVFNSHQALGGHRASHKMVKGCYAAKQDQLDDNLADEEFFPSKSTASPQFEQGSKLAGASRRKSKVHECTICHRIFSTGQALGGHKRCHWMTSNSPADAASLAKIQFHDQVDKIHQGEEFSKHEALDLNLPAQQGDDIPGAKRHRPDSLSLDVFRDIRLQIWTDVDAEAKDDSSHCHDQHQHHHQNNPREDNENENNSNQNNRNNSSSNGTTRNADDEADSNVKLEKLSDLKGINVNGSSSPWLKVGIDSTTDVPTAS